MAGHVPQCKLAATAYTFCMNAVRYGMVRHFPIALLTQYGTRYGRTAPGTVHLV